MLASSAVFLLFWEVPPKLYRNNRSRWGLGTISFFVQIDSSTADCGHLAPITFCFYQAKQARFSQGGSPCRWIDMGELIDSGLEGKSTMDERGWA
eukprot:g1631.t1